jgi:hypothetical protein
MSRKYTTAMGQSIDMEALSLRNEKVRAVGNMNVNARGDTIDSNNQVINDVTKRVNTLYNNSIKNPSAVTRGGTVPVPGSESQLEQEVKSSDNEQQSKPAVTSKISRAKKSKVAEPEISERELSEFDEFNEPNPKK